MILHFEDTFVAASPLDTCLKISNAPLMASESFCIPPSSLLSFASRCGGGSCPSSVLPIRGVCCPSASSAACCLSLDSNNSLDSKFSCRISSRALLASLDPSPQLPSPRELLLPKGKQTKKVKWTSMQKEEISQQRSSGQGDSMEQEREQLEG